jgi:hypothetical protein
VKLFHVANLFEASNRKYKTGTPGRFEHVGIWVKRCWSKPGEEGTILSAGRVVSVGSDGRFEVEELIDEKAGRVKVHKSVARRRIVRKKLVLCKDPRWLSYAADKTDFPATEVNSKVVNSFIKPQ